MNGKYCPEKMSPSLKAELNRGELFTVAVRVRKEYIHRLSSYMESLTIKGDVGIGRVEKEKLLQLSCKPWVLYIELLDKLLPQGEGK